MLTFRALALRQTLRSNERLTIEMSALESLYGMLVGQFTLSALLILNQIVVSIPHRRSTAVSLENYPPEKYPNKLSVTCKKKRPMFLSINNKTVMKEEGV